MSNSSAIKNKLYQTRGPDATCYVSGSAFAFCEASRDAAQGAKCQGIYAQGDKYQSLEHMCTFIKAVRSRRAASIIDALRDMPSDAAKRTLSYFASAPLGTLERSIANRALDILSTTEDTSTRQALAKSLREISRQGLSRPDDVSPQRADAARQKQKMDAGLVIEVHRNPNVASATNRADLERLQNDGFQVLASLATKVDNQYCALPRGLQSAVAKNPNMNVIKEPRRNRLFFAVPAALKMAAETVAKAILQFIKAWAMDNQETVGMTTIKLFQTQPPAPDGTRRPSLLVFEETLNPTSVPSYANVIREKRRVNKRARS